MLPKKNRYSFSGRLPQRIIHTELFSLRYEPSSLTRIAIVVSKKVDTRATKRNELKRLISRIMAEELKHLSKSMNLVFYLKTSITKVQKSEIETSVHETIKNIV